ncbi:hypothetical protein ACYX8G_05520 [Microbacterium saperdae]
MLDWLYGSRIASNRTYGSLTLRNLVLDIETLFDAADHAEVLLTSSGVVTTGIVPDSEMRGLDVTTTTTYTIGGIRQVSEAEIREFGVPDRNKVLLKVTSRAHPVYAEADSTVLREVSIRISPERGVVEVDSPVEGFTDRLLDSMANYLYENGTPRPDYVRVKALSWLLPLPIAVAAWVWLTVSTPVSAPTHLLIFSVLILLALSVGSHVSAKLRRERRISSGRSIRFRGESRERTQQRRADARQNLKVGLTTGVVGAMIGVIGTLLTNR